MSMTELLEAGRKILADKDAAQDEADRTHRDRMCALWDDARKVALGYFAPLGAEIPVQPAAPPDDWNPRFDQQHNITFYLRPWENCGIIHIRIRGRVDNDKWTWDLEDKRTMFYVDKYFRDSSDGDDVHLVAGSWDTTDSLPEALALCERHGSEYRRHMETNVRRKAKIKERRKNAQKAPAPGEALLEALETWMHGVREE